MRIWGTAIVTSCIIVFFVNIYLLITNKEIDRTKLINQVSFSKEADLLDTLSSRGVVLPSEEYSVFYNPSLGEIEEVLVQKGDMITIGTPLIKYQDKELTQNLELLIASQEKIELQIDRLEADIVNLENQLVRSNDEEDENIELVLQVDRLIRSQINDKDFNIKLLNLELDKIETEMKLLEEKKEQFIYTSKLDGVIMSVNKLAHSPNIEVLKIQSNDSFIIQGNISEFELDQVENGQKAYIHVNSLQDTTLVGSLADITMMPVKKPSVDEEASFYPYSITLEEPSELIHHGFHVDVEFVLLEKEGVITIPDQAVVKGKGRDYVFVLLNGILEKRIITTGTKLGNVQEITEGLEVGDRIVSNPTDGLKEGMKVIMPIQHKEVKLSGLLSLTKDDIVRLMMKGMFAY